MRLERLYFVLHSIPFHEFDVCLFSFFFISKNRTFRSIWQKRHTPTKNQREIWEKSARMRIYWMKAKRTNYIYLCVIYINFANSSNNVKKQCNEIDVNKIDESFFKHDLCYFCSHISYWRTVFFCTWTEWSSFLVDTISHCD